MNGIKTLELSPVCVACESQDTSDGVTLEVGSRLAPVCQQCGERLNRDPDFGAILARAVADGHTLAAFERELNRSDIPQPRTAAEARDAWRRVLARLGGPR